MDLNKIYQMFILGTGNLDEALKNGLGGVIFFSDDSDTEKHVREVENNIFKKASMSASGLLIPHS